MKRGSLARYEAMIADGRIVDEFNRGEAGEERALRAIAAAEIRARAGVAP